MLCMWRFWCEEVTLFQRLHHIRLFNIGQLLSGADTNFWRSRWNPVFVFSFLVSAKLSLPVLTARHKEQWAESVCFNQIVCMQCATQIQWFFKTQKQCERPIKMYMNPFEWPENGVKRQNSIKMTETANACIVQMKTEMTRMAIYSSSAIKIGQRNEAKMHLMWPPNRRTTNSDLMWMGFAAQTNSQYFGM